MPSNYSLERAAQTWCKPACSKKIMDVVLAEAFAEILDEERSCLSQGNRRADVAIGSNTHRSTNVVFWLGTEKIKTFDVREAPFVYIPRPAESVIFDGVQYECAETIGNYDEQEIQIRLKSPVKFREFL